MGFKMTKKQPSLQDLPPQLQMAVGVIILVILLKSFVWKAMP